MRYIALLMCLLMQVSVDAQSVRKLIVGRVMDKEATERYDRLIPFDISNRAYATKVYYFNTVQEGREMCEALNQDTVHLISSAKYVVPDSSGFYKVTLSENGSLVIKVGTASAVLEIVEKRKEIVTYVDASHHLAEVTVTGNFFYPDVYCGCPINDINILLLNADIALPAKVGKSNARLILQPYIMDVVKNERIKNLRPYVYDGKQYRMSLLRQQKFNKVIDSLAAYVSDEPLTGDPQRYHLKDTFLCPDLRRAYQVFVNIKLQDDARQTAYYEKTLPCTSDPRRCRKPFRFLEYPFASYELNPINYQERPKMERRTGVEDISQSFLLGKAELDPEDPNNEIQLDKLKAKLLEVVNGESSTLKELHLYSVSSPEGDYASNMALSQRRLAYARSLVYSVIPARTMQRLYTYTPNDSRVATWLEVADLLEQDTLPDEAAAIREIVEKYPESQDLQYRQVAALPYYNTIIKAHLPKLRSMKCEYTAEVYRTLTKEEILNRYQNDPDYRSGKKNFALYEYWHLFNMVKDPKELEELYRRAYNYSKELTNGKPWVLAANNLAVSYLKRDTVDINILEPLINYSARKCNALRTIDGRVIGVDNVEQVVANQLEMYLKEENAFKACLLAGMLPDVEEYELVKAFALCVNGYYRESSVFSDSKNERCKRVFDLVSNSSPLNKVVMCLAMRRPDWNLKAEEALEDLPVDDAKTFYLKAILHERKDEDHMASMQLLKCFKKDKAYIPIAEFDEEISESCFKDAKKNYDRWNIAHK